ncbi:hypothetical protein EVAR_52039_1 [Eumeta japonica]|uniref:Uncharacterized protein n=1 Tax=Eumeta variegata TaxID=151549 RepID=A0A4C1Z8K1_EUMVA|nr:hypothetical protein EVAR_52039_1 [Eumeta japonica]
MYSRAAVAAGRAARSPLALGGRPLPLPPAAARRGRGHLESLTTVASLRLHKSVDASGRMRYACDRRCCCRRVSRVLYRGILDDLC